ncbi:hypothetical protein Tco_1343569 [Tanacetum coccineum]
MSLVTKNQTDQSGSLGKGEGSGSKKDKTTMGDTLNIKANSTNASVDSNSIMELVDVLQPSIGGSIIPTSLATKICDIEKKMLDGKLVFVDNDGKPLQLKIVSTTKLVFSGTTMCVDPLGRSSFARGLIEIRVEDELQDNLICSSCKTFGHNIDQCPKHVVVPVIGVKKSNDGLQVMVNKRATDLPTSPPKDVLNTFNIYDLLSNEFDTVFEECKVDANATTGSSMDKRGKETGTSEVDAVNMENDNI